MTAFGNPIRRTHRMGALCLLTLWLAGSAMVPSAHAGMFAWVDEMFTFREDQKERVAPRRMLPPKEVYVPSYDEREHATWSNFYTRQDLTPQPYLDGSASKVMRPAPEPSRQDMAYGGSGGWEAVDRQAYENARAARAPQISISEPDQGPGATESMDVGQGVQIGEPVGDWRDGATANKGFGSRPGDFDYTPPRAGDIDMGGQPIAGRGADEIVGHPRDSAHGSDYGRGYDDGGNLARQARADGRAAPRADGGVEISVRKDPRYVGFNAKGQVTKYQVQRGDTLSGIAGQDAIYDNWKLWPLIYSANRNAIGHDPDNLRYQQKLGIPRGYSAKQAKEAEARALKRLPGQAGEGR